MESKSNEIVRSITNVASMVTTATERLINGEVDPISFITIITKLEKVIKSIKESKTVKNIILDELEKYPTGVVLNGIKITQIESGQKYNYDNCGDYSLFKMQNEVAELGIKIKEKEQFLKNLKGSHIMVDPDTGEVITVYPPQKTSVTTYKAEEVKTK